jgi:anti-sigma factor RsiW
VNREPTPAEILDWLEGRLSPAAGSSFAARLAGHPDAERFQRWAQDFRAIAASLPLPDPPPILRQRLLRLMSAERPDAGPLLVEGHLVSDSRRERELAGVRGPAGGDEDRYQLTYLAQDVDVILDIARQPDHHLTLRGQVLPPPGVLPVFEAAVQWPGGTLRTILGDDLGGFELYGVPSSAHTLKVTNDDLTVRMSLDFTGQWP